MRASELRIGNIVNNNGYSEWIISDGSDIDFSEKNCKGIPLTEEWLLKFGFEKTINPPSAPIWDEDIQYVYKGYRFCQDVNSGWFLLGYSWNTKHFKYVHQLQNLYFALTEEECTFTTANPNI